AERERRDRREPIEQDNAWRERARRIEQRANAMEADRAADMLERVRRERAWMDRHTAKQRRQEQDAVVVERLADRARDAHAALHRQYQAELQRWTALPWRTRR